MDINETKLFQKIVDSVFELIAYQTSQSEPNQFLELQQRFKKNCRS